MSTEKLNLKPFDLQKALAHPERVVTRDGRKITDIAHLPSMTSGFKVIAVVDGEYELFTVEGRYVGSDESVVDLFLLPNKQTYWFNVYRGLAGGLSAHGHETKEEAGKMKTSDCIQTLPIELELED